MGNERKLLIMSKEDVSAPIKSSGLFIRLSKSHGARLLQFVSSCRVGHGWLDSGLVSLWALVDSDL